MDNLSTYLKDHLAGSVAALNMIDHLIDAYEGKPLAQFFRDLRGEIAADQAKLKGSLRNWKKNTTPYEKRPLGSLKSFRARKFALANHAMARWGFTSPSKV
jgi:hypothetical protein